MRYSIQQQLGRESYCVCAAAPFGNVGFAEMMMSFGVNAKKKGENRRLLCRRRRRVNT